MVGTSMKAAAVSMAGNANQAGQAWGNSGAAAGWCSWGPSLNTCESHRFTAL